MSPSPFTKRLPPPVSSIVALEPVYNALVGMALLTATQLNLEEEPWLAATAAKLPSAQLRANRIIFEWLGVALVPTVKYGSFPDYLKALEAGRADELRDQVLRAWVEAAAVPDLAPTTLLTDRQRFMQIVPSDDFASPVDRDLLTEVHQLLNDPQAMQKLITAHLRTLWQTHFAPEWEKKLSAMRFQAEELNAREWPTESAGALTRAFLRRTIPDYISAQFTGVRHVVCVPSPYIQLHATRFGSRDTLYVFMLADFWHLPMRTEPVKRGEVKGVASALADDTRLRILELLAAHSELRAQEIIARLDATQSTISRHLKQLSNARLIVERKAQGTNKVYHLNQPRVYEFAHTLSTLLSAENARAVLNDVRLGQPPEVRPYLDRDGRVTTWPAKQKEQAVLDYLATKFTPGAEYSEKEVTETLSAWHTFDDPVYLRRALIDFGQLKRTPNGAVYWRA